MSQEKTAWQTGWTGLELHTGGSGSVLVVPLCGLPSSLAHMPKLHNLY